MFPTKISFPKVACSIVINSNHTNPSFYVANVPLPKPFFSRCLLHKISTFSGKNRVFTPSVTKEFTKVLGFQNGDKGVSLLGQETSIGGISSEGRSYIDIDVFERTLNFLTKWIVSALFAAVIMWRPDAEACWAVTGTVINTILCVTLKRVLNQERPVPGLKSDPGMPSSHAQAIFFAAVFVIFSMTQGLGINEYTIIAGGFTVAVGCYLSSLRVSQQFHTVNQVVVGGAVGSILSILWFWSWDAFVRVAFFSSSAVRLLLTWALEYSALVFLYTSLGVGLEMNDN